MKARVALGALFLLALSCGKTPPAQIVVPNERPSVTLSTSPQPGDSVFYVEKFTWFSYDADGQVVSFRYAVDPPVMGDTAWISLIDHELTLKFRSATPGNTTPTGIVGTDYHVFAVEAIDNSGLASAVASVAFTSYTVAPTARLVYPTPSRLTTASTPTSVNVQWTGTDPDGTGDKKPLKYKFALVEQGIIQAAMGIGSLTPSPSDLQTYFSRGAPQFASWDSVGADTTTRQFEALTPGSAYYFAVLAFDDAGAYDPRFDLDRNVLRLRPQSEVLGPKLTVSNDLVSSSSSSIDLSPSRIAHVTIPSGESVRFNWSATAATGGSIVGYRWVLDPVNGDITDETPRDNDSQTYRWSAWAAAEQTMLAGPYNGDSAHFLYVEARDNSGAESLVQIEIDVVQKTSTFLVIDDFQAPPDMDYGPTSIYSYQPYGNFPTEAVLDTLMFAVGGKPYQHRPPGTLSQTGVFAGFDYDTLDYRFRRSNGLPLDLLFRYQAVVIYTGAKDATTTTGSTLDGLRYAIWRQTPNPLVSYVAHGGKVWLFGDGIIYAFLLTPGDQVFSLSRGEVPPATSFPYLYWKLRSSFAFGGGGNNPPDYMIGATPYLPGNATPGRPWPPDSTRKYTRACDDPRVGPAASRNTARWSGLPCLDMTTEFNSWPSGMPSGLKGVFYVSQPNDIREVLDPVTNKVGSSLDTLYLWRSVNYNGSPKPTNDDGKPVMCAYEGIDSGPIVWCGIPLWYFDRTELRQLAAKVLASFGIQPSAADPTTFRGPGSAQHIDDPPSGGSPTASARPSE